MVGVLPLIAAGIVVHDIASRQAEDVDGTRLEDNVRRAGEVIDEFVMTCARDAQATANALTGSHTGPVNRSQLLSALVETYPYLTELNVVDRAGRVLESSSANNTGHSLYATYPELEPHVAQAFASARGEVTISDLSEDL